MAQNSWGKFQTTRSNEEDFLWMQGFPQAWTLWTFLQDIFTSGLKHFWPLMKDSLYLVPWTDPALSFRICRVVMHLFTLGILVFGLIWWHYEMAIIWGWEWLSGGSACSEQHCGWVGLACVAHFLFYDEILQPCLIMQHFGSDLNLEICNPSCSVRIRRTASHQMPRGLPMSQKFQSADSFVSYYRFIRGS